MKLAISSGGNTIDSLVDLRFGRCKYFIIIDTEKRDEITVVENEGAIQGQGAGIKAVEQIGALGVSAVITGNLGPNATSVLEKLGIIAYKANGSVKNAIDDFVNNKLEKISKIAEAHSGNNPLRASEPSSGERIFFPLLTNSGEDSEISPHFGYAPFFGVYDVEKKELKIIENNLDHVDPNKSPIDQIEDAVHPTTIFAMGIGSRAIDIISQKGLKLKTGNYKTIKEVIENLDKLEDQVQDCGHEH